MVDIMGIISGSISTTRSSDGSEREGATTVDQLSTPRQIDGVAFDGSRPISHWGRCDTSGSDVDKSVPLEGYSIVDGARIIVLFAYSHLGTEGSFTLNVNGTGARPIFYAHENATPDNFKIIQGDTYEFVFDGTHNIYRVVGDYDTNTTYDVATPSADGLMSKQDKAALDGLVAQQNDGRTLVIQCVDEGEGDELKVSYAKLLSTYVNDNPVMIYKDGITDERYYITKLTAGDDIITVYGECENKTITASINAEGYQTITWGEKESGGATNLLNGSQAGSLRSSFAAEEDENYTIGYGATAIGNGVKASGTYSHASGNGTIASGNAQTAIGKFNTDDQKYALVIGNGADDDNRSNAFGVQWNGTIDAFGMSFMPTPITMTGTDGKTVTLYVLGYKETDVVGGE